MTKEERTSFIEDSINQNLWLFLEYMEKQQAPSADFLEIIIGLKDKLEQSSFTELFVRVCSFQKIESLQVTSSMVKEALIFLTEKKQDAKSAYGLLRLVYNNVISLKNFPKESLINFQRIYEQTILRFLKTLQENEQQVLESLPASSFCFTTPIITALREKGKIFICNIPYEYLPQLIEIACYSFNEDAKSFERFFSVFRQGCKEHRNSFDKVGFRRLFQKILDETKDMSKAFFGSLDNHSTVLERSFSLMKEKKVSYFDNDTIHDLVEGDHDKLMQLQKRPSFTMSQGASALPQLARQIERLNPQFKSRAGIFEQELASLDAEYFKAIGIIQPLPL